MTSVRCGPRGAWQGAVVFRPFRALAVLGAVLRLAPWAVFCCPFGAAAELGSAAGVEAAFMVASVPAGLASAVVEVPLGFAVAGRTRRPSPHVPASLLASSTGAGSGWSFW